MANSDADFLKIELQLHFLETAMADTAFVVSHLLKDLNNSAIVDEQRSELQAAEHHLRTLLHQIRAHAQQEIETETQAREGQRVYHDLLQQFEMATYDFVDRAAALITALPPEEQADVQASLDVLGDFREDFSALE